MPGMASRTLRSIHRTRVISSNCRRVQKAPGFMQRDEVFEVQAQQAQAHSFLQTDLLKTIASELQH